MWQVTADHLVIPVQQSSHFCRPAPITRGLVTFPRPHPPRSELVGLGHTQEFTPNKHSGECYRLSSLTSGKAAEGYGDVG